jgi:hypothetical protein
MTGAGPTIPAAAIAAITAAVWELAMRQGPRRHRLGRTLWWVILAIAVVGVVGIARTMGSGPAAPARNPAESAEAIVGGVPPVARSTCPDGSPVKGNINERGQWIYHVPGGAFYAQTHPERCFASESEAWQAGFRPSRR